MNTTLVDRRLEWDALKAQDAEEAWEIENAELLALREENAKLRSQLKRARIQQGVDYSRIRDSEGF